MSSADDLSAIAPRNRRLDGQLDELLDRIGRSERALFLSQRALEDQLHRVRLLNGYALATCTVVDPAEILRLALRLLLELFPFEQGLAFLCTGDRLRPAAAHAPYDPEEHLAERLERIPTQPASLARALVGPRFWAAVPGDDAGPELMGLAGALETFFDPPGTASTGPARTLLLPLWQGQDALAGVVVLRRLTRLTTVERPLPSEDDRDFLAVVGNQIAVSVANALLFEDLRQSYAQLAAAQDGLVRKERLAAVGELAAQIAHEVRNPLGAILNSVSRLRQLVPPAEEARELVGIVSEESQRLARMVEDLLDFARPRAPSCRPEDLADIVRSAVEGASRAVALDRIELTLSLAEDVPRVSVDAPMIRQAVLNLLTNAVQAMSGHGRLTVRTRVEHKGLARFARIDVSDTGPGVPAELATRLFQPFFTTRASGTGLGLAVVRRLIEAHQGSAGFHSSPGQGSTFTLSLPLAE